MRFFYSFFSMPLRSSILNCIIYVLLFSAILLFVWITDLHPKWTFVVTKILHNNSHSTSKKSFFLQLQENRWKNLEKKFHFINFTSLSNPSGIPNKTITFQCVSICGGLGDRLRGLLMAFLFALLSNRQLVVDMQRPCSFDNYFQGNFYKWMSSSRVDLRGSRLDIRAIDHNQQFVDELKSTRFLDKWSKYDHIQLSTNMDFTSIIFSNPHLRSNPIIHMFLQHMSLEEANIQTLFSLLFEVLLKPTDRIVRMIDQLLVDKTEKKLVCIHLRIGKNPSNPRDMDFQYSANIMDQFINFISTSNLLRMNESTLLFLSSDSTSAMQQISQHFFNRSFFVPGPILQIDRPPPNVDCNDGFSKVVADFYMLSECHAIILTNSGFSAFANRRRADPYDHLCKYNYREGRIEQCIDLRTSRGWEPDLSAPKKLFCPSLLSDNTVIEI